MTFSTLISLIGSVSSLGLAVFVFLQDRHSLVHRIFAIGMVTFAIEAAITATSLQAILPSEIIYWQRARLVAAAFLPGVWLLFSLTFARVNYEVFLKRYRWVILAAFIIPFSLVAFPGKSFFTGEPVLDVSAGLVIVLGWSGYAFFVFFISFIVLILIHLENTLRASVGRMRWQVKFIVIGLGSILGIRIYTGSQAILFHSLSMTSWVLNSAALLVGNALIIKSLVRGRSLKVDFYLSHSFLFSSLTALIVGIYFLVVAALARVVYYFSNGTSVHTIGLFFFFSILGVFVLILSDRFRQRLKRFIIFNLRRPDYDYRKEWTEFTRATTSVMGMNDLCNAIVKKVSGTFDTLSTTIWLLDEKGDDLMMGGSTVFSEGQAHMLRLALKRETGLVSAMRKQQGPVDLGRLKDGRALHLKEAHAQYFQEARIRYCAPLIVGENLLGWLTLDDRVAGIPLGEEDLGLLKTIADQTAWSLHNLKLSERLRQTKEMEAFQTLSAFLMHDLKNLASTLSLTLQNLPVHFDNPEFRNDALRIMRQGVEKVNHLCGNLSLLSQKIELKLIETDLNQMVTSTLSTLNGCLKVLPNRDFQPVPPLFIDPGQIQKVLTNLILNANEAVGKEGEIRVTTGQGESWAILSVSDNGCGMKKEFLERSLFRPFKTTKKQGMGIGLFQSKMIVETHGGRIEVESEEGKGSTFRVLLPTIEK